MKIKTIFRFSLLLILFLGYSSFASASSKCYYTFNTKGWKTAFHVILNNPTLEILESQYFPNFETYVPVIFDNNGNIYQYKEAKRHCLTALVPVQVGKSAGQRVWVIPGGRIDDVRANNTYYFFMISKIFTESDYIVSNILKFRLDGEYQLSNSEIILWSDLPGSISDSLKVYLKKYLPKMGIDVSIDYIIEEINIDRQNYQLPIYDLSIINAANVAYSKKEEEREHHNPLSQSESIINNKLSNEEFIRAHNVFREDMLKKAGLWYKYKECLQKKK
ncbi:MAG: hypothetical protein EOM80_02970 [Erysipelotrichia bacterium]|nr:hypothetical protein [Erysipelotrichia bacterium]